MQLGVGLKGVVKSNKEGEIPDGFQNIPLSEGVLHHLSLSHHGYLLEDLHGKQLPFAVVLDFTNQKHLAVPCERQRESGQSLEYIYVCHIVGNVPLKARTTLVKLESFECVYAIITLTLKEVQYWCKYINGKGSSN